MLWVIIDTGLINYAIVSANTAVASVIIAISAVAQIRFIIKPFDLVGDRNPSADYVLGSIVYAIGLFPIMVIPHVNLSNWVDGAAGLAYGLGFLFSSWDG